VQNIALDALPICKEMSLILVSSVVIWGGDEIDGLPWLTDELVLVGLRRADLLVKTNPVQLGRLLPALRLCVLAHRQSLFQEV
jgi:hypothetical protein